MQNLTFSLYFLRVCAFVCVCTLLPFWGSAQTLIDTLAPTHIPETEPPKTGEIKPHNNIMPELSLTQDSLYYTEHKMVNVSIKKDKNSEISVLSIDDTKEFIKEKNNNKPKFRDFLKEHDSHIKQDDVTALVRNSCDSVHIFDKNIVLFGHNFISPFFKIARSHYTYIYKKDTIYEGMRCKVIDFRHKDKNINALDGWFFLADTTHAQLLRNSSNAQEKADFMLPNKNIAQFYINSSSTILDGKVVNTKIKDTILYGRIVNTVFWVRKLANLNFIDSLIIEEAYKLTDSIATQRVLTPRMQQITVVGNINTPILSDIAKLSFKFYNRLDTLRNGRSNKKTLLKRLIYVFDVRILQSALTPKLVQRKDFSIKTTPRLTTAAKDSITKKRDDTQIKRQQDDDTLQSIMESPNFRRIKNEIYAVSTGMIPIWKVEIGNIYDIYQYNNIQGNRFRLRIGNTMPFLSKWNIQANIAYGLEDKNLRYGGIVEYKYPIEKGFLRIGGSRQDDVSTNLVTGRANTMTLGLTGLERVLAQEDTTNIMKNFFNFKNSIVANIDAERVSAFVKYGFNKYMIADFSIMHSNIKNPNSFYKNTIDSTVSITPFKAISFQNIEANFAFRYAPSEAYLYGEFMRIKIKSGYKPIFAVNAQIGNAIQSNYFYCRTSVDYSQNFGLRNNTWINTGARFSAILNENNNAILLLSPNAYETLYTDATNINTVALYELRYNYYLQTFLVWHGNGYFFNRMPFNKFFKLREVLQMKILCGHLDNKYKTVNLRNQKDFDQPYIEGGIGIENIFKFLRLDCYFNFDPPTNPIFINDFHFNPKNPVTFDRFIFKLTTNFNF